MRFDDSSSQIRHRIDLNTILLDLKMQMCASRISGAAHITDNVTLIDGLSDRHCNTQHMPV